MKRFLTRLTAQTFQALLFFIIINNALADDNSRKAYFIELHNQTPESIISVIQPLLDSKDGITGYNNELIITTDASRIENIRQIVNKLDKALQNLIITVKNNNEGSRSNNSSGFSGGIKHERIRIDTGEPVRTQDGITVSSDGLGYTVNQSTQSSNTRSEQQIRAIEGNPAFIYTGQSINLPTYDSYGNVYNSEVDANRGFYVTARIMGDRVQLDISISNDTFDQSLPANERPIKNSEQLRTSVSGQVGEWISLGGVSLGELSKGNSNVKKTTTRSKSLGDISVKISPID